MLVRVVRNPVTLVLSYRRSVYFGVRGWTAFRGDEARRGFRTPELPGLVAERITQQPGTQGVYFG